MNAAKTRIIIVDDHTLVREWLANLLNQEKDLEVCGTAADAAQAVTLLEKIHPDLAIVDLTLRGRSGLDLIRDIRSLTPDTQIVVLSMHEETYYAERALRAGARAYVTKRESTQRIVEAIRAVRAGHVYANAEILAQLASRLVGQSPARSLNAGESLSDRELEVFRRLGAGESTRRIANEMGLSIKTVQVYCARIKEKLSLASGSELMREAVRWVQQEQQH